MCVLANGYKKSVRTCHAHHVIGIAEHHQGNEQKNKYPILLYTLTKHSVGCTRTIIYIQNGRISVSILLLGFGDFTI